MPLMRWVGPSVKQMGPTALIAPPNPNLPCIGRKWLTWAHSKPVGISPTDPHAGLARPNVVIFSGNTAAGEPTPVFVKTHDPGDADCR